MLTRFIAIDVETTDYSVQRGGRVIEVGAVAMEHGVIVAEFETLINTGAPISHAAYLVHGISEEMLAGEPAANEAWPDFHDFLSDAPLVAHNAPFDSAFVRHELSLLSIDLPNPWYCTVKLARNHLPKLDNHRLETVYRYLFGGLPEGGKRHRALDDARLAARIWITLDGS